MDPWDPYIASVEAAGHKLKRDPDGSVNYVDTWSFHGYVTCVVCESAWCIHCEDEVEPCQPET